MFFKEFLSNTKEIGAVVPSSCFLTKAIVSKIHFCTAEVIVDLGGGTGSFSDEIVMRKSRKTVFLILETNKKFFYELKNRYKNIESVYVINEKAENLDKVLYEMRIEKIDYVISGLPFLNFSIESRNEIFENIFKYLKEKLLLFQYTTILEEEILKIYRLVGRERVYLNLPPAYIYVLDKV